MLFRIIICLLFLTNHSFVLSSTPEQDFDERLASLIYHPPSLPPMPQSLIDMGLAPMPPLEEQEKRIYGMDERSFKDMMTRIETLYNSRLLRRNQIRKTLFNQEDFDREKFYEEEFKFHWNLTVEYHFGPAYMQIDQNFPRIVDRELRRKWGNYICEYCPNSIYQMERAREYYVPEQQKLLEQQMAKEADLIQKMRDEDQKERHTPEHHTSRSTSTPCEEEVISESDVIVSETKPLIPSTTAGLRKRR